MSFTQDKLDHIDYGHDVWVRDIAHYYPKTRIYNVCTDLKCDAAKNFSEIVSENQSGIFVALIDAGAIRWFDSKIWHNAEKAKTYYQNVYGGSDLIITILPVGGQ